MALSIWCIVAGIILVVVDGLRFIYFRGKIGGIPVIIGVITFIWGLVSLIQTIR